MRKRSGLPERRLIRHLIARERRGGHSYYWQPPTKMRQLPGRPDWLKSTPLKDERGRFLSLEQAMRAAEMLNARLDQWRDGRADAGGGMAALIGLYLRSRQFQTRAPRTQADYEKYLLLIRDDMGDVRPESIDPTVIAKYRDHLVASKRVGERSADYRVQMLRLLFSWARRHGHFKGDNPGAKPGLKVRPSRTGIWTLDQLRALAREPYPIALAVRIALYTVQRQGDILAMRWTDITAGTLSIEQRKTGRKMQLPLHPRLRAALRLAPKYGETVIARTDGKPYTEDGFRTLLFRACVKLGKGRPTFHDIRRTAASMLAAGGISDTRVALWTGHKRRGEDAILDAYIVAQAVLKREAFPIMSGWRV